MLALHSWIFNMLCHFVFCFRAPVKSAIKLARLDGANTRIIVSKITLLNGNFVCFSVYFDRDNVQKRSSYKKSRRFCTRFSKS